MPPRKFRRCRPLIDVQEHIAPISTFVPGLWATTPAATVERTVGGGADNGLGTAQSSDSPGMAIQAAPSVSVPSIPPLALTGIGTTGGGQGDPGSSSADSSAGPAAPIRRSASDQELFDNLVALVTPAEGASPSGPPAAAPSPARAAAQTQSGAPVPNPVPFAPVPTPPANAPIAASTGASPTAGMIRPMALAPSQPTPGTVTAPGFHSPAPGAGHPGGRVGTGRGHAVGVGRGVAMASGSGGGGGSGSTAEDKPPTLMFPGVGLTLQSQPGVNPASYTADAEVPIGWIANIQSSGLGGEYTPISYKWKNGTTYSGYTSAAANQPAPPSVSLAQNVATNASNYQFIVDSNPRQYTITLDVTYQNNATGEATLTFTSDAPTGSIFTPSSPYPGLGTQTYTVADGDVTVQLNPGITIAANISTDANTAGHFMFMQVCTSTLRKFTNGNNQTFYKSNTYMTNGQNFNGPLIDDGGASLGVPCKYAGNTQTSLTVGASSSVPTPPYLWPMMTDPPAFQRSVANLQSLSANDSFSTYLMYISNLPNSVWIAVSELDWSWSETASQPFPQPDPKPTQQPQPTTKTPSGAAAFPGWVNKVVNLMDSGWMGG